MLSKRSFSFRFLSNGTPLTCLHLESTHNPFPIRLVEQADLHINDRSWKCEWHEQESIYLNTKKCALYSIHWYTVYTSIFRWLQNGLTKLLLFKTESALLIALSFTEFDVQKKKKTLLAHLLSFVQRLLLSIIRTTSGESLLLIACTPGVRDSM